MSAKVDVKCGIYKAESYLFIVSIKVATRNNSDEDAGRV